VFLDNSRVGIITLLIGGAVTGNIVAPLPGQEGLLDYGERVDDYRFSTGINADGYQGHRRKYRDDLRLKVSA
jgi:hypothetical protein